MTAAKDVIIRLQKVTKTFNHQVVLRQLDLDIERGKTTVVIGPSGCGKTVLLKHIVMLIRPDLGQVFFEGQDITHLNERQLVGVRQKIGFVFQGNALFDSMTVAQNICFPLSEHRIDDPAEQEQRCRQVLRIVGMEDAWNKMPEELSGGQKKRIALARSIVLNPDVILYDEPTTGLDPIRADLINELIIRLQAELKTTAVVVTHDMESAKRIADRIVMLYDGHFLADTTPQGLKDLTNDKVIRFIEGRATDEELASLMVAPQEGSRA